MCRRRDAGRNQRRPGYGGRCQACAIEQHTVYPTADGATKLNVSYGAFKSEIPLAAKDATVDRPVSFHLDVMPVFMRSGCKAADGAARGKDGSDALALRLRSEGRPHAHYP